MFNVSFDVIVVSIWLSIGIGGLATGISPIFSHITWKKEVKVINWLIHCENAKILDGG